MATEARKLQVGGFVLTAMLLGAVGLFWFGSTRLFQSTVTVATYYTESVQGLERGASVKYRGVPAGQVQDIGIAPDTELIEVIMEIDREFAPLLLNDPTVRAQLALVGISGLRYVEMSSKTGDTLVNHPELAFDPPHPVIPSAPSDFAEIQTAFEDIYEKLMTVDLQAVTDDLRVTLQSANSLLQDERLSTTLTNLETTSRSAALVAEDVRRITRDLQLEETVAGLEAVSVQANTLLTDLNTGASGQDLRQALRGFAQLTATSEATMREVQLTVERLDVAVGEVEGFSQQVREQPSLILFAEEPEARAPGGRSR